MRDFVQETESRVAFIRGLLKDSGAKGIVYANSGGKDCTLAGILCKMACEATQGVMMPCQSRRNYEEDIRDATEVGRQYGIEQIRVDLTEAKETLSSAIGAQTELTHMALANINPRLRMTVLYAIALSRGYLVAGTGNRSERYTGYFTKWGDGAFDFNPIGDLTATEVRAFLRHLKAPERIIEMAPSAGLYDGQTDEDQLGVTYAALDEFLLWGTGRPEDLERIARLHRGSGHKRAPAPVYGAGSPDAP